MTQLQYHAQTMELLGREPVFSPTAQQAIEKCEAQCGRKLPGAVREWYSLTDIEGVLDDAEEENRTRRIDEFLEDFASDDCQRDGSVYFSGAFNANTGCKDVIILDGSDDPPVDENYLEPERPPFSEYVQRAAWWNLVCEVPSAATVVPEHEASPYVAECGPPHLDFLIATFAELPRTVMHFDDHKSLGAHDHWNLRFYGRGQRLELMTAGDPTTGVRPARYELSADTFDRLLDLYECVWPAHGVRLSVSRVAEMDSREVEEAFRRRVPDVTFNP